MRLMEGADIYQIAKNCRASVEMIEKFYAAHIKGRLDASQINVVRPRAARKPAKEPETSVSDKNAKSAPGPAQKCRRQQPADQEIQP